MKLILILFKMTQKIKLFVFICSFILFFTYSNSEKASDHLTKECKEVFTNENEVCKNNNKWNSTLLVLSTAKHICCSSWYQIDCLESVIKVAKRMKTEYLGHK